MLKGNLKNQIFAFMHFLSLLFSFLLSELYFFSAKGVDFPKYKIYLEYFQDNIEQTSENPGLFYYYINHLVILLKQSSLTSLNRDLFLNSTIQTTNNPAWHWPRRASCRPPRWRSRPSWRTRSGCRSLTAGSCLRVDPTVTESRTFQVDICIFYLYPIVLIKCSWLY